MSSSRARSSCNLGIQGCESQLCAGRHFNLFPSFLHLFLLLVHVQIYLYVYVCVCMYIYMYVYVHVYYTRALVFHLRRSGVVRGPRTSGTLVRSWCT